MKDYELEWSQYFYKVSGGLPVILHVNPLGLLRLGKINQERIDRFERMIKQSSKLGSTIAFPVFSYSYTSSEVYNVLTSISKTDPISEILRIRNPNSRTIDPLFSYLVFGEKFSKRHFEVQDYSSFGKSSLIEELFLKNGYLCAIGGVLNTFTEIHFLEQTIGIMYRENKFFEGEIIDVNGEAHLQTIEYYCRNYEYKLRANASLMAKELRAEKKIEIWKLEELDFIVEAIKIQDLYKFIKDKIRNNPHYLCEKI
jgi:aminoglycoside 3-N-acetyltransferase